MGPKLLATRASATIHLEPWWNPAVESQASHRVGQTRPVTVYRLIASGTIEERIVELHEKKRDPATSLVKRARQARASAAVSGRTAFLSVPF